MGCSFLLLEFWLDYGVAVRLSEVEAGQKTTCFGVCGLFMLRMIPWDARLLLAKECFISFTRVIDPDRSMGRRD